MLKENNEQQTYTLMMIDQTERPQDKHVCDNTHTGSFYCAIVLI